MNSLTALVFLFVGANALSIDNRPNTYPNQKMDLQQNSCEKYERSTLDNIPHECLYNVICGGPIYDQAELCFTPGQEPEGRIEYAKFRELTIACRHQAICGYKPV